MTELNRIKQIHYGQFNAKTSSFIKDVYFIVKCFAF